MGNPLRGEADFKVGDRTYRLVFCWNAAVEFEEESGRTLWDAVTGRLSAKTVRAMLWAGLREKHPDVTPAAAGELIDQVGRPEAVRVMRLAMRHFFPDLDQLLGGSAEASSGGTGSAGADPPGPAPGTKPAPAPAAPGAPGT